MIKKYKLTDQNMKTHNGFQWELNKWVEVDGDGELCTNHKLHYYHHPLLAILLNPIHANIKNPRLFEVSCGTKGHIDNIGLKGGCNKMKLVKELSIPNVTLVQKIAFGILCSLVVYKKDSYILWANNWLNNIDRSKNAAYAAAYVTDTNAVYAAAYVTDTYASYAAAAIYAANAAVNAAAHAAKNYTSIKLVLLAKKALKYI